MEGAKKARRKKKEPDACTFVLPRTVCKREITRDEALYYLGHKRTELLTDFTSRFGRPFSATLVLQETGRHGFEFQPRKGAAGGKKGGRKKAGGKKAGGKKAGGKKASGKKAGGKKKAQGGARKKAAGEQTSAAAAANSGGSKKKATARKKAAGGGKKAASRKTATRKAAARKPTGEDSGPVSGSARLAMTPDD